MARLRMGTVVTPSQSVWRFEERLILIDDCPFEPLWPVRFTCTGWKSFPIMVKSLIRDEPITPACPPLPLPGKVCCVSLKTVLCSIFTPSEEELVVLIDLRVNPTPCPLWKSADVRGSSCPLSSSSNLVPLNLFSPLEQDDLFTVQI